MHTAHILWRLNGSAPIDPTAWSRGLALHVRHTALTTITMRIGEAQRSYLAFHGCGRCVRDDCEIGCPSTLLRRLMQRTTISMGASAS